MLTSLRTTDEDTMEERSRLWPKQMLLLKEKVPRNKNLSSNTMPETYDGEKSDFYIFHVFSMYRLCT